MLRSVITEGPLVINVRFLFAIAGDFTAELVRF